MAKIVSSIKNEHYKVEIKSPTGNVVIADEPIAVGGRDLGFSPKELLASALAACTSATLRMYADRKGWELQEVRLEIDLERDEKGNNTIIERKLDLIGNLDETQRTRLLKIAESCPIHKILNGLIEINSQIVSS